MSQATGPDRTDLAVSHPQARWRAVPCAIDERPWPLPSVGLVALTGDAAIEPELRAFLGPPAQLHTTRVSLASAMSSTDMAELETTLPAAARLLLPGGRLEVVAIGCTAVAASLGTDTLRALVHRASRRARDRSDGRELAELADRGVRSVAVLSPYADAVNSQVAACLSSHGVHVVASATWRAAAVGRLLGRTPSNLVAPSSILEAAIGIGRSSADAVFIACTGLRCADIVSEAERRLCKPVITSNSALAAHVLRLAGQERRH